MKKTIVLIAFLGIFAFGQAYAQQEDAILEVKPQVNYDGQPPIDMDLDGLTDQAETQIHKTDPNNEDTDSDGYYDGTEVLSGSDALDEASIPGMPPAQEAQADQQDETPWPWYVSRVSGLVGFALLYISIFLGLTIRVPFLRKAFAPLYALEAHCWIAFQATLFALIHGVALMFDKFISFRFVDVFIPFAAKFHTGLVALGIVSFYLMVILTASSYARKHMSHGLWRALHFLNIILYLFSVIHAYYLGTDLQNPIARNIFVYANILLIVIMLVNMFSRIRENIARKNALVSTSNEIL